MSYRKRKTEERKIVVCKGQRVLLKEKKYNHHIIKAPPHCSRPCVGLPSLGMPFSYQLS